MIDDFDIVILGLESREDRWQRCLEILTENEIKRVTRYTTTPDYTDLYRHASKDYLRLLSLKQDKPLLVFEDDFELVSGWKEIFIKALRDLPYDFDMLYLGCNLTAPPTKVTDTLYRVWGAWCLHGVLYSPKFMKWVLKNHDVNKIWVLDEYFRTISGHRKFFMTYPMIAYQRESYSDFAQKNVSYDIYSNKFYKNL